MSDSYKKMLVEVEDIVRKVAFPQKSIWMKWWKKSNAAMT